MGVSTNAMLVYGYIWRDECKILGSAATRDNDDDGNDEGGDDGGDWQDIIAEKRGIVNPWGAFPEEINALPYPKRDASTKAWIADNREKLDAYYAAKRAIEEEYNVEIDSHGSGDWSVPIVCIKGVSVTAYRGHPKTIDPSSLAVDPAWDEKLARFCADLEIDTSEAEGPGWFLASYWG